jgi:hypothetical protein
MKCSAQAGEGRHAGQREADMDNAGEGLGRLQSRHGDGRHGGGDAGVCGESHEVVWDFIAVGHQ